MLFIILRCCAIFLSAFIGNIVWSLYIKKISEYKHLSAANYGVCIGICFIVSLLILITSFWYSIFHLSGLWLGTYYHQQIEDYFLQHNTFFLYAKNIFSSSKNK